MIRPPAEGGIAFSDAGDGDLRSDQASRARFSSALGIGDQWATVAQVHGNDVVQAAAPGDHGSADAIWTDVSSLPVAVFTADCLGVAIAADGAVGVAHAGWRGIESGVVSKLRSSLTAARHSPRRAFVGPGIAPCCYEVGPEVAERFEESLSTTSWGTTSVDLVQALGPQLAGLEAWFSRDCTQHQDGYFSHRSDATGDRMATVGWMM